jgi:hypothetical protein
MAHIRPKELLKRTVDEFERRGWRDDSSVALGITRTIQGMDQPMDLDSLVSTVPRTFLERNGTTRAELRGAIESIVKGIVVVVANPLLVPMESIDTFAKAARVSPQEVASIAQPLNLLEGHVKNGIGKIIGEPYLEKDWGGELTDILTARVVFQGRRVRTAFVLKGRGTHGPLTPKRLGKNADQIRRMSKEEADIYVVQHVGPVAAATRDQLADMIAARRYKGYRGVVGSIWDGVDVARLFVAHSLIDASSGDMVDTQAE